MERGFYERLSTQDSSFVSFEGPRTHMHVAALAIFEMGPLRTPEGGLDIERVRALVGSRLHLMPRYRQRLSSTPIQRHPIWVDDSRFNLEYHVRHTSLPKPGSEENLKKLVGRIMSQQLDREKPLWEMWLAEGLEGDRFAMIVKAHHCMVDGISGVGMMTNLLSLSPDEELETSPTWTPRPLPGTLQLLIGEGLHAAATPLEAARAIGGAIRSPSRARAALSDAFEAMGQAMDAGMRVMARTPLNQPIGTHRRVDWEVIDLSEIKDLRKRLDATVNDVVLAIVSGAIRRFLKERRTRLRGIDFRVVIPVNMREGDENASAGNRVSAWFLSLPISEPDPLRRFEKVRRQTQKLRDSKTAQGIDIFTRIVDWTGSALLARAGVALAAAVQPYNLIVTNVPGPQRPLYMLGAPLLGFFPQLPLFERQGLGVAVMSYNGKVYFGLVGDWDLVPDLPSFADSIGIAFEELRRAAVTAS